MNTLKIVALYLITRKLTWFVAAAYVLSVLLSLALSGPMLLIALVSMVSSLYQFYKLVA